MKLRKKLKIAASVFVMAVVFLSRAPWLDDQAIRDRVFQERAHKDGTMGWIILPNGIKEYGLICDYNVMWAPFGRWVASCEGGYYVAFWGGILI